MDFDDFGLDSIYFEWEFCDFGDEYDFGQEFVILNRMLHDFRGEFHDLGEDFWILIGF